LTGRRCKFEGGEKGSELRRRGRKEREGERSGLSRSLSNVIIVKYYDNRSGHLQSTILSTIPFQVIKPPTMKDRDG